MSTSFTAPTADRQSFRDRVEASAEREGEALDWFRENLDAPLPQHISVNPVIHKSRYPLAASLAAHQRLVTLSMHKLVWGPSRKQREVTTAGDRQRRTKRRLERMKRLMAVEQELRAKADAIVKRSDVHRLIGCGASTIDHAITARELCPMQMGRERVIPAAQVVQYIRRRLAVA